jgi:hypothetical protein
MREKITEREKEKEREREREGGEFYSFGLQVFYSVSVKVMSYIFSRQSDIIL